jgi:hypothetical protein
MTRSTSHHSRARQSTSAPTRRRTFPTDAPTSVVILEKAFNISQVLGSSGRLSVRAKLRLAVTPIRHIDTDTDLWFDITSSAHRTEQSFPATGEDAGDVAWLRLHEHPGQPKGPFQVPFDYRWVPETDLEGRKSRTLRATRWLMVEPAKGGSGDWTGVAVDERQRQCKGTSPFKFLSRVSTEQDATDKVFDKVLDRLEERVYATWRSGIPRQRANLTTESDAKVNFL